MDPEEREEIERVIAARCAAGEFAAAATAAIKGYGPEILGYLFVSTRRDQDTAEIFSDYCEDLWKGLPSFRYDSSFRTWSYRVAYHALARARRKGARERRRVVSLAEVPEVAAIVDKVRTRTLPYLRTEVKEAVMRLRDGLDHDDQTLLILRIDRRLDWDQIARIIDPEPHDPASLARLNATLRKRFARLKARLGALSRDIAPVD